MGLLVMAADLGDLRHCSRVPLAQRRRYRPCGVVSPGLGQAVPTVTRILVITSCTGDKATVGDPGLQLRQRQLPAEVRKHGAAPPPFALDCTWSLPLHPATAAQQHDQQKLEAELHRLNSGYWEQEIRSRTANGESASEYALGSAIDEDQDGHTRVAVPICLLAHVRTKDRRHHPGRNQARRPHHRSPRRSLPRRADRHQCLHLWLPSALTSQNRPSQWVQQVIPDWEELVER